MVLFCFFAIKWAVGKLKLLIPHALYSLKRKISSVAYILDYKIHLLCFIRDGFIRDEMVSTENFGKIRDGEYSTFSSYKACYIYTVRGK